MLQVVAQQQYKIHYATVEKVSTRNFFNRMKRLLEITILVLPFHWLSAKGQH